MYVEVCCLGSETLRPMRRSVRLVTRASDAIMRCEFCVLPPGQDRHGHIP